MKANYFDLTGKKVKSIELPEQFDEPVREDLIQRAVLAIHSHDRQAYGTKPRAGMRHSSKLSRRRRKFKTSYGHGISRVPRKTVWHRGTQFGWVGALAPQCVGGRRAHPPKTSRDWTQKINIKERRKAIRSALSAAVNSELVKIRGHLFKELPTVVDSKIENLKKTKEVKNVLIKLGLEQELERTSIKKVRSGKGKTRGRRYRKKKGPLLIVSKSCSLEKAGKNIPGIDICTINNVNVELLAPGAFPGRLTIFSEDAVSKLEKQKLFTNNPVKEVKK